MGFSGKTNRVFSVPVLLASLLIGIVSMPASAGSDDDPLENINRRIFAFNHYADSYILAPSARVYEAITPDAIEAGVGNVFDNLFDVNHAINSVLQLKLKQAGSEAGRFLINSTIGVFGVFDVARRIGLENKRADFGQTLAYWGVDRGPYIVIPLLGSATVRSGAGLFVDSQLIWPEWVDHVPTRNVAYALETVDNRAELLKVEELVTGDQYVFIRDAYLQQREFFITGELVDDFDDGDSDFEDWDE